MSSDGGSVLLIAVDQRMQLTQSLCAVIPDERQAGKVEHPQLSLLRQRVFAIANGYPDCNDAARLSRDPMLLLAAQRAPCGQEALASQPTLSRFENAMRPRTLLAMGEQLARSVLSDQQAQRRRPPRLIHIDLDPTCDPTHGQQEFSVFNGFYGTSCYLPLVVTVSFDAEPQKFVVAAVLRPGNAGAMKGVLGVLLRLVELIREYFPRVRLIVRADSAYAHPVLLECLEAGGLEYVIGLPSNAVLKRASAKLMRKARRQHRRSGQKVTLYGETRYRARSWPRARRVVFKAEVVVHEGRAGRDNDRYVVTNMKRRDWRMFAEYHGHHDMENRIKEVKNDLRMDRTSCESFLANQLRVLLTLAAAVLMQALQQKLPAAGEWAGAQMGTIREKLFKRAVRVIASVRRVVLQFSDQYPWTEVWRGLALAVGARSG
jgi:hypothetical protein